MTCLNPASRRLLQKRLIGLHEQIVMLNAVPALRNGTDLHAARAFDGGIAHHGAMQAVLLHRGEVLRIEQLDGLQADLLRGEAEVLQRDLLVAPLARRVPHLASSGLVSGFDLRLQHRGDGADTGEGSELTAGEVGRRHPRSLHGWRAGFQAENAGNMLDRRLVVFGGGLILKGSKKVARGKAEERSRHPWDTSECQHTQGRMPKVCERRERTRRERRTCVRLLHPSGMRP
jgi:hypothetical protein